VRKVIQSLRARGRRVSSRLRFRKSTTSRVAIAVIGMLIGAYAYTCRRLFKEIDKDLLAEWDLRLACIADERDHLRSRPPVGVLEAIFAMPFPPERQFASVIRRWEWAHRHRHSHDSPPRTLSHSTSSTRPGISNPIFGSRAMQSGVREVNLA